MLDGDRARAGDADAEENFAARTAIDASLVEAAFAYPLPVTGAGVGG
jgi:hypothetical protein